MTELDFRKFANTVLYLLERCGDRPGIMALVKMVWYADWWHYRKALRTITGGEYLALDHGPVIEDYTALFDRLVGEKAVQRTEVPVFGRPNPKQEFHALMSPDPTIFTDSEINVLDEVIAHCAGHSGSTLSMRTHLEGPWTFVYPVAPRQRIPRALFRWLDNRPSDQDVEQAKRQLHRADVAQALKAAQAAAAQAA